MNGKGGVAIASILGGSGMGSPPYSADVTGFRVYVNSLCRMYLPNWKF